MNRFVRKGLLAAATLSAVAVAAPGRASAAGPCPSYTLTQPFLAWNDTHEYTLLPGEDVGNVDAVDWQLSGGAGLEPATLEDGTTGQVLDMPAGSAVETPPMCVDSSYASARAMVTDLAGVEGVSVSVSYQVGSRWEGPFAAGMIKNPFPGWSPSKPIMLHSAALQGTHQMRLTLTSYDGEYELYNIYVDPRHSH